MPDSYVTPEQGLSGFTCPACGVYAHQKWYPWVYAWESMSRGSGYGESRHSEATQLCVCRHCDQVMVWQDGRLVFPRLSAAPPPDENMPEDVEADYREAASVVDQSPRAAAALLRLAIQKLVVHLGRPGKNLNADIGVLVKDGLPVIIQQSLDVVRVVGNNAVHPGEMELGDDRATANALFGLVNLIVDRMIGVPKRIGALTEALPAGALEAIARRDSASD